MSKPALPDCTFRLKVLADRTRLALVQELLAGSRRVCELMAKVHFDQSLVSHHLRVLRRAGLVESRREGRGVRYALSPGVAGVEAVRLGCCSISFGEATRLRTSGRKS